MIFCALVACCLIAGTGLIAYYVPERTCSSEPISNTDKPSSAAPTDAPTEPISPTTTMQGGTTMQGETTTQQGTRPPREIRLDKTLMAPVAYNLTLQPCLYYECGEDMRFRFYGSVDILVDVYKTSSEIIMNSFDLEISEISVTEVGGLGADIYQSHEILILDRRLVIQTSTAIQAGKTIWISIEYIGHLRPGFQGFYRSTYERNGETVYLATTQMESTSARRALPCWDEPTFRATFDTTIIHMENMTALSNGMELGPPEDYDGILKVQKFETTPKMPTYLLAFVVSDFNCTEGVTDRGVRMRVWSRPEAVYTTDLALKQGIAITEYFEKIYKVNYTLPKQDMVAIPDFAAGAMENWGLILYRESALLFNEEEDSVSSKQYVGIVVAHELAHQWFGDLVTLEWWEHLWLNEGSATYNEMLGLDGSEPSWEMDEQFLIEHLQGILRRDSLASSRPIVQPVESQLDISSMFDSVSYSKGGSVLRMLNDILGTETYLAGMKLYLDAKAFNTAVTDDLWFYLNKVQNVYDIKTIMDTWTLQMGYPLITAKRTDNRIDVQQEHFLLNEESQVPDSPFNYLWYCHLTHAHGSNPDFDNPLDSWMNGTKDASFILENSPQVTDWYIINVKQYNYYRVNYDRQNWERLTAQLLEDHTVFPPENRAALIDDAFTLAGLGIIDYPLAVGLTGYLRNETNYVPWYTVLNDFDYISDMFSRYSGYGPFEKYMLCQIDALYSSVGFTDDPSDPHLDQLKRIEAIEQACFYGNEDCLLNAETHYADLMADPVKNGITPNLKTLVYCNGIREGGSDEWEFGLFMYTTTTNPSERNRWLYALTCSREPWILSRLLNMAFEGNAIRPQDRNSVYTNVAENYVGRALAWDFIRANWDELIDHTIIDDVAEDFNTEFDLEELLTFGSSVDLADGQISFNNAVANVEANIAWMTKNQETLMDFFQDSITSSSICE